MPTLAYEYWYNEYIHFHYSLFISQNALPATAAAFGQGTGNILLDNVVCQGNESSILDCRTNPVGTNDCEHSEDVGVICQSGKGLNISHSVRLP